VDSGVHVGVRVRNITNRVLFSKTVHWLLAVLAVLYLVTGFGITEFRVFETVTFGLLTKNLAFKIHVNLWIPFVVLLGLHVSLSLMGKRKKADSG
jgi:hypothetical protein